MAGFFRRLRRKDRTAGSDEEGGSTGSDGETSPAAPGETIYSSDYKPTLQSPAGTEAPPAPGAADRAETVAPAAPSPPADAPSAATEIPSIPPPLPEADRDVNRPVAPRSPALRCFLCDTDLQGSYCPTCHMTWAE